MSDQRLRLATNLTVAGTLLVGVLLLALPRDHALQLTREGGIIESLSAMLAAGGCTLAALKSVRSLSRTWGMIALVLFWLYLRELDYQKHFTSRSVESIGFYSDPTVPLGTKLSVITALVPFVLAGIFLARDGLRHIRRVPGPYAAWLRATGIAGCLLAAAIGAEKFLPKPGRIIEEVFELGFVGLIFLVVASEALRPAISSPTNADAASQPGGSDRPS